MFWVTRLGLVTSSGEKVEDALRTQRPTEV